MMNIAVIGAGVAGLTCARQLSNAGLNPVVFDKGRGIGGRVATRRSGDLRFDHGAPYAQAIRADFSNMLHNLVDDGYAAQWIDGTEQDKTVGTPNMSSLLKGMAAGLDVRLGTPITAVVSCPEKGWRLRGAEKDFLAHHIIITVPAPQVAGILGEKHPLANQITNVKMSPILTLMIAVNGKTPIASEPKQDDPLVSIIQNSGKPNRPQNGESAWVAHAGLVFSLAHLEKDLPDITKQMLPLLCDCLNVTADRITHAAAHRWRYGRVSEPLEQPFLRSSNGTMYLGGDWCVGPNIEDAWSSGTAIATDLLAKIL